MMRNGAMSELSRSPHEGIAYAREAGLYPYFMTVGSDELLQPERFFPFIQYAGEKGALEVHLIEPSAAGRIQGKTHSSLESILDVMNPYFAKPRTFCIGKIVNTSPKITSFPTPPEISHAICKECLPESCEEPKFFRIRQETLKDVGRTDLQSAYDQIHGDYNEFWVSEAGKPVAELECSTSAALQRNPFRSFMNTFP